MKNYKKFLLNKLIDSYENSKVYKNETLMDKKIYFRFNTKNIKEYFDEYDYKYKEEIDNSCLQLERENFIQIYWGKDFNNHIIDKISLVEENIKDIYKYLNREEKKQKENSILSLLDEYYDRNDCLGYFTQFIKEKINNNQSIKKYLDINNFAECEDILKGIEGVLNEESEIFKRNFSIKIYGDSKRYETIEKRVLSIINDFSKDDVITYNIVENYTFVYFKGNIKLKMKNSTIICNDFIGGVAISSKDIENIQKIEILSKKLVTIENLTSFNNYYENDAAIYLGGFQNKVKTMFLIKIYNQNPNIKYYHFGDIDVGGFKILVNLKKKTNIPFKPLNMDEDTLIKYLEYGRELTNNDVKEINRLLNENDYKEYRETLKTLLKYNKKLEQEIVL